MSLEVRTVTVCLFGHRDRKRDCLSTVTSDGIWRTDMWRQRERERERERESERERERESEERERESERESERERASVRGSRPIVT